MTADEIRKYIDDLKPVDLNTFLLGEIAAQLAELNGHPVAIEREPTAEAIVKATDYEFNLDQACRMVDLVSRNAVRS